MTNDELKQYLVAVEYEIGAGTPGADTTYALGEEVLQLRAELARLKPLAEAAVNRRKVLNSQNVTAHMFDAVQDALEDAADAYAQAQDGA